MKLRKKLLAVFLCVALLAVGVPMLSTAPVSAATTAVSHTLDFSSMDRGDLAWSDANKDTIHAHAQAQILSAGGVAANNLTLFGNHTSVANPGGHQGEGYYIQRLDAQEGKLLTEIALDLSYFLCDVGTDENGNPIPQGYINVFASQSNNFTNDIATDNVNNTDVPVYQDGNTHGNAYKSDTMQSVTISLDSLGPTKTVFIKVAMQHWATWEGAAVRVSTLRAKEISESDCSASQRLDFTAMGIYASAGDVDANQVVKANAGEAIKNAGAVDAANLFIVGNHFPVANPGGYGGEGYYVQKLDLSLGQKEEFLGVNLNLSYFIFDTDGTNVVYVRVYYSTDGTDFSQLLWEDTNHHGANTVDNMQKVSIKLPVTDVTSTPTVYVKVTMQHWETYEGAAVKESTLALYTKTYDGTTSTGLDFTTLAQEDTVTAAGQQIVAAGAVESSNLYLGSSSTYSLTSPKVHDTKGYYVQKFEAGRGTAVSSAQLTLNYFLTIVSAEHGRSGSIRVYVSEDGINWPDTPIWSDNSPQGYSDNHAAAMKTATIDLPVSGTAQTVYAKVVMQHGNTYDVYEAAAVKTSTITGTFHDTDKTGYFGNAVNVTGNALRFGYTAAVSGAKVEENYKGNLEKATIFIGGVSYPVVKMGAVLSNLQPPTLEQLTLEQVATSNGRTLDVPAEKLISVTDDSATFAVGIKNIPDQAKGVYITCRPYIVYVKDGQEVTLYGPARRQTINAYLSGTPSVAL